MAEIKGVNILGTIVPYTTDDLYATHDAKYGRGGWRGVQTLEERDAILKDRMQEGMAVRVADNQTTYIWTKVGEDPCTGAPVMEWVSDSLKIRVTEGYVDVSTDGHRYDPSGNIIDASKGDYYIYLDTNQSHTEEWGRTGYVYDGSLWKALNGNVNAENVYFPQGVDRTETWGRKTAQPNVSKEEAKGKNLKDLIEFYILKEQFPSNVEGKYSNTSTPGWGIHYNAQPTEHEVYLDASYNTKATSGAYYTAGTKFYIPALSYEPKIDASLNNSSSLLSSGDTKNFSIGPSYIQGMTYGYWVNKSGETYGSDDRIAASTVTFNDASVTKVGGGVYRPKDTRKTATATYTYNNGTSYLQIAENSKITDTETKVYTSSGDASVNTDARAITLKNTTGDATVKLYLINGNYWSCGYTNNTIPKSDLIRVSTNKNNPGIEDGGTTTYKDVSVAAKTVGSTENKKIYDTSTLCWTFTAKSAYPTYVLVCTSVGATAADSSFDWQAFNIDKYPTTTQFNFADDTESEFCKRNANYQAAWVGDKSYKIRVPQVLGHPSARIWANKEWMTASGTTDASISVDVNDNATNVLYWEYTFPVANGLDAKYKLQY